MEIGPSGAASGTGAGGRGRAVAWEETSVIASVYAASRRAQEPFLSGRAPNQFNKTTATIGLQAWPRRYKSLFHALRSLRLAV
ncbi:protein of unknown function [Methylocella tundrae]|uniref:Uncharacterized protein n=1 Tax=Methylocella tundrae TaxID=227605 RepID=A0A4U8Z595_METTU|nr:protein of unknown function [Methylocella tundrae]